MPPPACAPVPAFPPALDCAPATPDIPYSKPAINTIWDVCLKFNVLFIVPPFPLGLASIQRKKMVRPPRALFRAISRITASRRAFRWKEAG
jgi:hypothetical protein